MDTRAVLWDLDGTLLDSGEYHWISWYETLREEGYVLTRERFTESFGQRNDTILRSYFGPDLPVTEIERITDTKEVHYRHLVRTQGIDLLPGVREWLVRLQSQGWKQAIASSAPALNIETILEVCRIEGFFEAVVSAQDVKKGKPDPEVFLLAAKRLRVPSTCCVVVEDAPVGVEGARRAGMPAIGVLTTVPSLKADLVIPTLQDLPEDAFDQLLQSRSVGHSG